MIDLPIGATCTRGVAAGSLCPAGLTRQRVYQIRDGRR